MKLAAIQFRPPHGQPALARQALRALILRAEDAQLIVCPEMAISGYVFDSAEEILPFTEPARGETFDMLRECAMKLGAWIVCGIAERGPIVEGEPRRLYNSALTVSPQGELINCYRKVLLYELDERWATPGHERPIIEIPELGSVTPGICMDLNDDGFGLHLVQSQPKILAFCTNWVEEGVNILPYWRMRLFGWKGWMVAADRWGEERGVRFYGRSAVLSPDGVVGVLAPVGDGVLFVETDNGRAELR